MSAFRFASYSRLLDKEEDEDDKQDTYAWCVFVDATAQELASIRQVEYTLHSSFPNPVRVSRDAAHCFPVMSLGLGGIYLENQDYLHRRQYLARVLHIEARRGVVAAWTEAQEVRQRNG